MSAYLICNIKVTDPVGFGRYRELAAPLIAQFGGRYLVRGGAVTDVEGATGFQRVVVLEFASMDALKTFYFSPEYTAVKAIREAAATADVAMVEGYAP